MAHSLWAAPLVSVPKGGGPGGQIRLCGDYKVTIYPELENDQYLLPKPEEVFRKLAGGKRFLKIDLTYAYQMMSLEESSRHTHTQMYRGVYQFTQLPFGMASTPALFQRVMDTVEAISMTPQPRNVQELRSFLGLLHYYGKFLIGLAMLLHALDHLLKAGQKWT